MSCRFLIICVGVYSMLFSVGTVASEEVSPDNETNWKIAATIIHCGTAGNISEKARGLSRALNSLYPTKRWIILLQETEDLPWSGRYINQWDKLEQNNLCGYDLIIFQDDKKECDAIFMKGPSQQLIINSVQNSFSLDNIEERVLQKDEAFNLKTDLVLTFRNGIAFASEEDNCIEYVKVDGIHVIYSGEPQFVRVNVG